MRPVIWLALLVAAALLASAGQKPAAAAKRPNVLLIASDDMRPELGCYGNPIVKTPNLDRLAARGVRFDRAYCQYPLCNPSRTSLITGRFPTTTGVLDNLKYFRDTMPDLVTLPQHFRQNGYAVARTGKILHGGIDDIPSWDEGGEPGMPRQPRTPDQAAQYRQQSDRWVALEGDGETTADYRSASRAIQLLEKYGAQGSEKPFFIAAGFAKPHSPLIAPKKYFDLYDPEKIPLPPNYAPEQRLPEGATPGALGPNGDLFIQRPAPEKDAREMIRAYYACISFVDDQVGRVLAALDRLKLRDDTIVVFFGDHGYHLSEMGKWSKHNSLYEVATRVPVLISAPGMAAGKASPRTVGLIDLYPTLAELAGLPAGKGIEGHSLAPLLKDPQAKWEHPAYSYSRNRIGLGQSVRTERYRYTVWASGAAELYDYSTEPYERRNVAGDPAYAAALEQLKRLVR